MPGANGRLLFMKARYHVVASAGISLGLQAAMHSWPATLGCFLSGVLMDLDHYLEYWLIRGKFPHKYKELVEFCLFSRDKKVYLFFHGYEFLFLFWLLFYFFPLNTVWLGVALGLTAHIIFDQLTNPIKPLFYFLTYRIKHRFEKTRVLSNMYFERSRKHFSKSENH